jgi:UrcA family protein
MNTNASRVSAQSFIRLAAVLACVTLSGYAEAGDQTVNISQTVSAVGIDVNTPDGARKLYGRLESASRSVCSDHRTGVEPPQAGCADDALGNAIRSANRSQLTRVYLQSHSVQTAQAYGIRIPMLAANK